MSILLVLPFPPSVNACWRNVNGRTLISEKGRKFRGSAIVAIYEQLRRKPIAITEPVTVKVKMYPPTNHKRDIDNYLKAPFDALTHANIWKDDGQVKRVEMEWCEVVKGGRFEITISMHESASKVA
ncbi:MULTISPECIES: RusA family crossover junction endodeoxyribonuclease [Providencia]|uniref:Crossover junction endodeoxyribonuclease rusA n=1 Tax=Providencia rettgeri TaxID=587 RepID=A0A379FQT6_PRORE|nr:MULTISPECIES: RusA family crossover junction endodeoxyribonuclease [Providencia]ELR5294910.1 RusA family crossover junction endodeoxyribonuclease [Providencia rettgeri]MBG5900274.1 RusA family crossover junction endodeoxyribonuclease [Providencia rettgeri]MBS0857784.1 RusA family crossover junction endodeoxyribonuclease [Providencia rettgeri]MBS0871523.1 RusA family crossover junction endodeoxyribonuclease [Providencia rettgeri]MBS0918670.1 RusA family crossover junction endodeoxyribonuclea